MKEPTKIAQRNLPSQEQIEVFAWAARDYVERSLHIHLDETEESLAFVDQYIRNIRKQGLPKTEIIDLIANALGVYFGQVVLTKLEGQWYGPLYGDKESIEDPRQWRIELREVPLSFSPVALAMAAIKQQENEDLDTTFAIPAELTDLLAEMFARMAPVSEDYYFSLTGRLETLLYSVELLSEMIQTKKAEREKATSEKIIKEFDKDSE